MAEPIKLMTEVEVGPGIAYVEFDPDVRAVVFAAIHRAAWHPEHEDVAGHEWVDGYTSDFADSVLTALAENYELRGA